MISVYGGFPPKSVCVQFLAGKQDCQQFPFYVGVVSFSRSKCLTEKTYRFAVLDKNDDPSVSITADLLGS